MNRFLRDEDGQATVLFALLVVLVFGFTAITLDVARIADARSENQKAVDAAALAGALVLTDGSVANKSYVVETVEYYLEKNADEIKIQSIEILFTEGKASRVQVTIQEENQNYFAPVMNLFNESADSIDSTTIYTSAIAQKKTLWDGFAIPFLNMDNLKPVDGRLQLRVNSGVPNFRNWLDGDEEGFNKHTNPEEMEVNPYDGLKVEKFELDLG